MQKYLSYFVIWILLLSSSGSAIADDPARIAALQSHLRYIGIGGDFFLQSYIHSRAESKGSSVHESKGGSSVPQKTRHEFRQLADTLKKLHVDGKLGPQTRSALRRFADFYKIGADFSSVYSWVEKNTSGLLIELTDPELLQEAKLSISHKLLEPEATRYRSIYLSPLTTVAIVRRFFIMKSDVATDMFKANTVEELESIHIPSLDEVIKQYFDDRRETDTSFEFSYCAEINAKNKFGGYSGYMDVVYLPRITHLISPQSNTATTKERQIYFEECELGGLILNAFGERNGSYSYQADIMGDYHSTVESIEKLRKEIRSTISDR